MISARRGMGKDYPRKKGWGGVAGQDAAKPCLLGTWDTLWVWREQVCPGLGGSTELGGQGDHMYEVVNGIYSGRRLRGSVKGKRRISVPEYWTLLEREMYFVAQTLWD